MGHAAKELLTVASTNLMGSVALPTFMDWVEDKPDGKDPTVMVVEVGMQTIENVSTEE